MRRKGTWMLGVCTCAGAMNLRTRRFCLRFVSPLPFQDTRFHSLVFDVIVLFPLDQMEREKNGGEKKGKKNRKVHSPILSLVWTKPQKCFHRSRSERAWNDTEVETETVNFEGDIPPVPVLNSTSYISRSWVHDACQTRRSRSDEKRKT